MNISVFEVTGPVMVGPSSSHTAGAARLARVARGITASPFSHVSFGLHGSFAKTYKGHGTDCALVAGALGLREDDERLAYALAIAEERGMTYDFYETELDGMHENSVKITFMLSDGGKSVVIGSSTGGAQIVIRQIDGFDVEFTAQSPTLLIRQQDQKGIISEVTKALADNDLNIGIMRVSRRAKGDDAFCLIETDNAISREVVEQIRAIPRVVMVRAIQIDSGER